MASSTSIALAEGFALRSSNPSHATPNHDIVSTMDQAKALKLAKEGNEKGFRWLFYRYRSALRRLVLATSQVDRDAAKDIVQNAFIRAFRSLDGLKQEHSFEAWIVRITRRETIRYVGQNKRLQSQTDLDPDDGEQSLERLEKAEKERLMIVIRELAESIEPASIRDTAIRYYFGTPATTDELAAEFQVPAATVRKRLFLFRNKLRDRLLTGGENDVKR